MDEDYGYDAPRPVSLWRALPFDIEPFIAIGVIGALVGSVVLYVLIRGRANKEAAADPQLGLKFVLGLFRVLAYHLLLFGGVALLFGIIMKSGGVSKELIYRPALALVIPASILFGVHTWALTRTNQAEHPMPGRVLAGASLIISGVMGSLALFLVFQILFEKGASGNGGRFFWSLFLVYGTAWAVQAVRFYKRVQLEPLMATAPAQAFYPPPAAIAPPGIVPSPGVVVAAAPPVAPQVPLPAPMAAPLAPPGSAPGSTPGGTTL